MTGSLAEFAQLRREPVVVGQDPGVSSCRACETEVDSPVRAGHRSAGRFLSARELHVFYTPQPEEIAWSRALAGTDEHLLAAMVQLKAYGRLGYFPELDEVPTLVVLVIDEAGWCVSVSWLSPR